MSQEFQILIKSTNQSVIITSFVMVMMLVIEYLNVQTRSKWNRKLNKNPFWQIIIAGFLGITPGCLGAYTVVSLYSHRMMSFAALVTVMIATFGDEAFFMFSLIPRTALLLTAIIFIIAIITGLLIMVLNKSNKKKLTLAPLHFVSHTEQDNDCVCFDSKLIIPQLKMMTFSRFLLIFGMSSIAFLLLIGNIGPEEWDWEKWLLTIGISFFVFVSLTAPDHFLEAHVWKHIIRVHLLRIFLWTFGTLLFLHFFEYYFNIEDWIRTNSIWILLIALLIGILPESGPHMVFITMFASGLIPFSVLLSSSIVQDGHGMLPLLAESKKDFVKVKLLNIFVGLVVGIIGNFFKF